MIKHEKFKQFTVGTSGLGGYDLIENCCFVFFNVARKKTLGFKTNQQKMGVSESGLCHPQIAFFIGKLQKKRSQFGVLDFQTNQHVDIFLGVFTVVFRR